VLKSEQSFEAKCHSLIDAARNAGGPDNITVVLLRAKNGSS
jgi:serine/threonine protein phosphatase PrpC